MAQCDTGKPRKRVSETAEIIPGSLDPFGQAVPRYQGTTCFTEGELPGGFAVEFRFI